MGADKDIPAVFKCQNTQRGKAHLERKDRGSFRRDFCTPHSQLLAQTQVGGTKRETLTNPSGQRSCIWLQSLPPACLCWAGLSWNQRGLLRGGKALGIKPSGKNRPHPTCSGASSPPSKSNEGSRGPNHLPQLHRCVPELPGWLCPQYPSFLTFVPPAPTCSCSPSLALGIVSPEKLPSSPISSARRNPLSVRSISSRLLP